jgi:hypothetical protein
MSYGKGPFAFFDGTSSEYRKVLKLGDSIAGYKITNIEPNSARLASSTNEVQLRVGMQLRREENGAWHVATAVDTPSPENAPARTGGRPGMSPTLAGAAPNIDPAAALAADVPDPQAAQAEPPADPGAANADSPTNSTETDPVLRRLMERRNQEVNR